MLCRSGLLLADCTQTMALIDGFADQNLLADKGYDTDATIDQTERQSITPVIPTKKNRKKQRGYDREIYKARHLVENAFLHLKQWRGIAARYAKNTAPFLAAIHSGHLLVGFNLVKTQGVPRGTRKSGSLRSDYDAATDLSDVHALNKPDATATIEVFSSLCNHRPIATMV